MCVCVCACVHVCVPQLTSSQTTVLGRPIAHHEGAARVALHVHEAVLVYAPRQQHRDAKIGPVFGSVVPWLPG